MAFSASYDNPAAPSSGAAVSNREDLTDLLSMLSPQDTPFVSLCPKRKAKATNHEWTIDSLASPDTSGVLEAQDVSTFDDKFANKLRIGNVIQGFRRSFGTSVVQDAVSSVQSNFAQASVKSIRELKRDMEAAISSGNDKVVGSGSAKAQLRGMFKYVSTSPGSDIPSLYTPASAQVISNPASNILTEALLNSALASCYNTSGVLNNVTMIADTGVREDVADFVRTGGSTDSRQYNINGTAKTVTLAVDVYNSDFGKINVVNSNPDTSADSTNHDRALIVNLDYVGLASLIPLRQEELENQGAGRRGYAEAWATLECLQPQAHASVDLNK